MRVGADGYFEGRHRRGEAGETRETAAVRGQQTGLACPHIVGGKRHQRIGLTERRCRALNAVSAFKEEYRRNGPPRAVSTRIRSDNAARVTACSPSSFHLPVQIRLQPRHHLGRIAMHFEITRQTPAVRSRNRRARMTIELSVHKPKPLSASASEVVVLPVPLCAKTRTCASLPGKVRPAAWSMNWPEASIAASSTSMPAVAPTRETLSGATMISADLPSAGSITSESRSGKGQMELRSLSA